ncbi:MAG: DUF6515 family protein [Ferruginibacter sp.]
MTNLITSSFKHLLLLSFSALFFLNSNAQGRGRGHDRNDNRGNNRSESINRNPRYEQSNLRGGYGQSERPQRDYSNRGNRYPGNPSRNSPVPSHRFPRVNRDFRDNRVRVDARPGYGYYNNAYRYRYNRAPVYSSRNPGWRYSYLPARRTVITSFPFQYQTINYGGCGYRFYNGTYYRPYNNAYIVVAPPVGLFINVLPFGYRRIYVRDNPYYYYNGTYYDEYENNYRVVAPPVGAVVESIPEGYETVTIDGETYYQVDGVQYKPVVQDNGEIWYEVIK